MDGWMDGGEIWRDNVTCVKCRRVCAHRNMFNGFHDCSEGSREVAVSDGATYAPQTTKGVYSLNGQPCRRLVCHY